MDETRIVLGLARTAALIHRYQQSRRTLDRCATCNGRCVGRLIVRDAGFCGECLDRSRALDEDDIGGES